MPEFDTSGPKKRTRVYGVLLAALVAAGSLALVAVTQQPKEAVSSPGPAKAAIVPQIAESKSEAEILIRGKSFAPLLRRIAMPYSGEILEIHVKEGQAVDKDQVLVTYRLDRESMKQIEAILFPAQILNQKNEIHKLETTIVKLRDASLPVKQMNLKRAQIAYQDLKELVSKGLGERQALKLRADEVKAAEKEVFEVQESLQETEATLANTKRDLKFREADRVRELNLLEWNTKRSYGKDSKLPQDIAYLKAPMAGYVVWLAPELRVNAEPPQGFPALSVAPLESMVVRCKVHELDLVKLKMGDKGTVTFDAIPEKQYTCKLTRIPFISRNPSLEVPADYEIEALLQNPEVRIRDGMTCNVKVSVKQ